jgi:hypothetical protein
LALELCRCRCYGQDLRRCPRTGHYRGRSIALPRITDEIVLAAIVEFAGDGYCLAAELFLPCRSAPIMTASAL